MSDEPQLAEHKTKVTGQLDAWRAACTCGQMSRVLVSQTAANRLADDHEDNPATNALT